MGRGISLLLLLAFTATACSYPVRYRRPSSNWPDENDDAATGAPRDDAPIGNVVDDRHMERYDGYFLWPTVERHYYVPTRRCEQGPIALQLRWQPSRYIDHVILVVYVRHPINGRLFAKMGSAPGDIWQLDMGGSAQNWDCLSKVEEATVASGAGTADRPSSVATAAPVASSRPGDLERVWAATPPQVLREVPEPPHRPPGMRLHGWEHEEVTFDLDTGLPKQPPFDSASFVIWFSEPNDLEDATFVIARRAAQPVTSDSDIVAHLRSLRAKDAAELAKTQKIHEEHDKRERERDRFCDAHHEDTECWGPGGYEGARQAAKQAPPNPPPQRAAQPYTPLEPPPAALAESIPPSPSSHARWIPGYWHWLDGRWHWIGGRWRVPPDDVERELTVHAPSPPPPPRQEAPPAAPSPQLVWTPGFWQWDGVRFLWVNGGWQVPPAAGAVWSPDRWELRTGRFIFLPGGWIGR